MCYSIEKTLFRYPPKDFNTKDVLNRGNRVLLMTIDRNFSTIHAVEQVAEILAKERQKTVIVLGIDKDNALKAFQRSPIKNRVRLSFAIKFRFEAM